MSSCGSQSLRVRSTAIVLACLASSCSLLAPNRAVSLSTSPPGATITVNGKNSGFVTPCLLQFDVDEDVRIDLEVAGFRRETRYLTPHDEVYSILWTEMNAGPQAWRFPLFLGFRDVIVPVKWIEGHAPGTIHIDLDRRSDDVAAARGDVPSSRAGSTKSRAEAAKPPAETTTPQADTRTPR